MINNEIVSQEFKEGQAIRYCFLCGFSYHETLLFLEKVKVYDQLQHVIKTFISTWTTPKTKKMQAMLILDMLIKE